MKYLTHYAGLLIFVMALIIGCGPSEKEKQRREQARQDSLEQVRQERMEQQRQDSLAKVRADSMANAQPDQNQQEITLSQNGSFTLQVESWRSKVKAQKRASAWKERGFNHAFVVQYGNENTGDVWYRVRLGRADSRQQAEQIKRQLEEQYQAQSWIGTSGS